MMEYCQALVKTLTRIAHALSASSHVIDSFIRDNSPYQETNQISNFLSIAVAFDLFVTR